MKGGHRVTEYVPGDLLFVQREKEKRGPCPNLKSRNNSYPQHHSIVANFDAPLGVFWTIESILRFDLLKY